MARVDESMCGGGTGAKPSQATGPSGSSTLTRLLATEPHRPGSVDPGTLGLEGKEGELLCVRLPGTPRILSGKAVATLAYPGTIPPTPRTQRNRRSPS